MRPVDFACDSEWLVRRSKCYRRSDLGCVAVGTTVQEKAVSHPTDAKLQNHVRERLVELRQSYASVYATAEKGGQQAEDNSVPSGTGHGG